MVGEHTGRTYKLGQKVRVRVTDADKLQRTVNFMPADDPEDTY